MVECCIRCDFNERTIQSAQCNTGETGGESVIKIEASEREKKEEWKWLGGGQAGADIHGIHMVASLKNASAFLSPCSLSFFLITSLFFSISHILLTYLGTSMSAATASAVMMTTTRSPQTHGGRNNENASEPSLNWLLRPHERSDSGNRQTVVKRRKEEDERVDFFFKEDIIRNRANILLFPRRQVKVEEFLRINKNVTRKYSRGKNSRISYSTKL